MVLGVVATAASISLGCVTLEKNYHNARTYEIPIDDIIHARLSAVGQELISACSACSPKFIVVDMASPTMLTGTVYASIDAYLNQLTVGENCDVCPRYSLLAEILQNGSAEQVLEKIWGYNVPKLDNPDEYKALALAAFFNDA